MDKRDGNEERYSPGIAGCIAPPPPPADGREGREGREGRPLFDGARPAAAPARPGRAAPAP